MTPLPLPIERALAKLGGDLSRARRLRRLTQASLAERIDASLATVRRMERGDPRIPLHFVARALMVFGELPRLQDLLDSREDEIGRVLADERLPQRVRVRKAAPVDNGPGRAGPARPGTGRGRGRATGLVRSDTPGAL